MLDWIFPVIILSAHLDDSCLERAKKTEPYGYLLWPVGLQELRATVEMALHKHEADRRMKEREKKLARALEGAELGWWDWDVQTGKLIVSENMGGNRGVLIVRDRAGHRLVEAASPP